MRKLIKPFDTGWVQQGYPAYKNPVPLSPRDYLVEFISYSSC